MEPRLNVLLLCWQPVTTSDRGYPGSRNTRWDREFPLAEWSPFTTIIHVNCHRMWTSR